MNPYDCIFFRIQRNKKSFTSFSSAGRKRKKRVKDELSPNDHPTGSYEPNRLVYKASTPKDGVVVFSEIYYPGWQATIDGQPVDIARADYILRAINVPAGEHTIEMWFDPQSIQVTESIAYAALALLLIGVMVLAWTQRNKIAKKS